MHNSFIYSKWKHACGSFDVRLFERGDNSCYEAVLNTKSWPFWFILHKYLYRIVGCCLWVFFHKTTTHSFLPYRYDVIHSNLRLHEELINTTSRTIEVCKTTFRNVCNEIKFNVYYNNKKKSQINSFHLKTMIIIPFGDFLFTFFRL